MVFVYKLYLAYVLFVYLLFIVAYILETHFDGWGSKSIWIFRSIRQHQLENWDRKIQVNLWSFTDVGWRSRILTFWHGSLVWDLDPGMRGKSEIGKCWVGKAKQVERHHGGQQVYFKEKEFRTISLSVLIIYLLTEPQTHNAMLSSVTLRAVKHISQTILPADFLVGSVNFCL